MRTTLDLDEDILEAAKELARFKGQGLGRALSDLARRGLIPETNPTVEVTNGIPIWIHRPGAVPVNSEMIRNLAEEE